MATMRISSRIIIIKFDKVLVHLTLSIAVPHALNL
jgi:hypothetical protein